MSAKNDNKVTVSDVAAQAVEEKLVVPAQAEGEKTVTGDFQDDKPEVTVAEDGKKSLKERLIDAATKLKENKKALIAVGAAAGVAALAFAKYAKTKAEQALVEAADEETVTEDGQPEITPDDSAV